MTSGNVANIGPNLMFNTNISTKDSDSSGDFLDVMNKNVTSKDKSLDTSKNQSNVSDKKLSDTNNSKASDTKALSKDDNKVNDVMDNKVDNSVKDSKVKTEPIDNETIEAVVEEIPEEVVEAVSEILNNFANEVAKVLGEALEITEDELENAMANLNITFADLINPKAVTELMVEVTNVEDSVSLVLNEDLSNALSEVRDLANNAIADSGVELPVINEIATKTEMFAEVVTKVEVAPEIPTEGIEVAPVIDSEVDTDKILNDVNIEAVVTNESTEQESEVAPVIVNKESDVSKDTKVTKEVTENVDEVDETTFTKREVNTEGSRNSDNMARHDDTPKSFTANVNVVNQNAGAQEPVMPEAKPVINRFETMQMITQISEQARVNITKEVTSLEMILNPESLGKIYLNVSEKQGAMKAQIVAQNEMVKEALENQVAALKENLNKAGVKVEAVEVSVGTHEFERNLEEGMHEKEEQSRQQEEQAAKMSKRTSIDLNNLDDLQGLMSEEDKLVAQMMKDQGNSVNYMA